MERSGVGARGLLAAPLFPFSSEDVGCKRTPSALGSCWWGAIWAALRCSGCFSWWAPQCRAGSGVPGTVLAVPRAEEPWQEHGARGSPAQPGFAAKSP